MTDCSLTDASIAGVGTGGPGEDVTCKYANSNRWFISQTVLGLEGACVCVCVCVCVGGG